MSLGAEQFAQEVFDRLGKAGSFEPSAHYDADGDCMEIFVSNEPFRGERLDSWTTVYLSEATGEPIGALIKDVRKLMAKHPGFDIDIHGDEVNISLLLRASAWSVGDAVVKRVYKTIIAQAEQFDLRADVRLAGCC